jgi:hypothetical protein
MKHLLTHNQRALIESLARYADSVVELYVSDSINGESWTLRYSRKWAEPGGFLRSESHMVFAVRKPVDVKDDDAVYAARMKPRVEEAKRLFAEAIARRPSR